MEPVVIPALWDAQSAYFPYVINGKRKCHAVAVGYPEHPRTWKTKCGWPFVLAEEAVPTTTLPECYKSLCEKCLGAEREAARANTVSRVGEVGVEAS